MVDRVSESIDIGSLQARDYARIFDSRNVGAYTRFIRENHRADNSIFNNAIFNNSIFNNHYLPRHGDQEQLFLHDNFNTTG